MVFYKPKREMNVVLELTAGGEDVGKECYKCSHRFERGEIIYLIKGDSWDGNFCERCYFDISFDLIR